MNNIWIWGLGTEGMEGTALFHSSSQAHIWEH